MQKVAVVIPVYKVELYLRRCIDSLLGQSYPHFRCVLVDDGSPDGCGAICDEYAGKDIRVHVIHRPNGGVSAARNSGIKWVLEQDDCSWMTFVDPDDWVSANYLESLVRGAESCQAKIAVCCFELVENTHKETNAPVASFEVLTPEKYWCDFLEDARSAVNYSWGKLFAIELFQNTRFSEDMPVHEDLATIYRVLFSVQRIAVTKSGLYYYFQNPKSFMHVAWSPRRANAVWVSCEQLRFFEQHGYDSCLKASLKTHFKRINYNLKWAARCDCADLYQRLKETALAEYRKYRGAVALPLADFYYVIRLIRPIYASTFYPFARLCRGIRKMFKKTR